MNTPVRLLGLFWSLSTFSLHAGSLLQPHDIVAICGDSITEQRQYSVFVEDYLLMCQPVEGTRAVQFGWGGESARGLQVRLENDVLPFKPTVVTTCYGMNDGGYAPINPYAEDTYRKAMTTSVEAFKAAGVRAILVGSPGCVDGAAFSNPKLSADEYNKTLDALRAVAQEVAQKEGVGFVDVHTPMMQVMAKAKAAYGDKYPLVSGGGVHPANNGHLVMAYAFLKGLGCDGEIGTITVDLGADTAQGTPGQKIVSCHNGAVEVESTRYPFCFQGSPDKPEQTTASILHFLPFNEELNRYRLVVKGLKGSKAKVTWGSASQEFSAADLSQGVNLAAAFLTNPFCGQFNKVNGAVQTQQVQETMLQKNFLHNLPAFKAMAPHSLSELDKAADDGITQNKDLWETAAGLVIPVHHLIKIEAES